MDDRELTQFYAKLTLRRQQVLQLVSEGLRNQEIADRLCVTAGVVAEHLTIIYDEIHCWMGVASCARPNRYVAVRLFAGFFERNPNLRFAPGPKMEGDLYREC